MSGAVWRRAVDIQIKSADAWRRVKEIWIRNADVWRLVHQRSYALVISTDTTDYKVRTSLLAAGWDGIVPIDVTLTINSGIYVFASATSTYAIDFEQALPAGSGKTLVTNNGKIRGKGGVGGEGGDNLAATAGTAAGHAIRIYEDIDIDNTNGEIFGGGGGGGGGGMVTQ